VLLRGKSHGRPVRQCRWSRPRHRCPQATVLPGRHGRYGEVSRLLHQVFEVFTPLIEPIALDEAFLDVSGGPSVVRLELRDRRSHSTTRLMADLKLSCSVGIAAASCWPSWLREAAKPIASASGTGCGPGVVVVLPEHELEFLHPRPGLRPLGAWGPDGRAPRPLRDRHCGDLAQGRPGAPRPGSFGRAAERSSRAGVGPGRPTSRSRADPVKSVGHEETFAIDVHDPEQLRLEVVRHGRRREQEASRIRPSGPDGDGEAAIRRLHHDHADRIRLAPARWPPAAELVKTAEAAVVGHRGPFRCAPAGVSSVSGRSKHERTGPGNSSRSGTSQSLPMARCMPAPAARGGSRRGRSTAIRERYGTVFRWAPRRPGRRVRAASQAAR